MRQKLSEDPDWLAYGKGSLMIERSRLIEWIRGELVGPSRPITEPVVIDFSGNDFVDPVALRSGPLAWRPNPNADLQEVLYFQRETPHRKYGAGLLHPGTQLPPPPPDQAVQASDTLGIEPDADDLQEDAGDEATDPDGNDLPDHSDDFEVTSPDIRHPSTLGISFCVRLDNGGRIVVRLPANEAIFLAG